MYSGTCRWKPFFEIWKMVHQDRWSVTGVTPSSNFSKSNVLVEKILHAVASNTRKECFDSCQHVLNAYISIVNVGKTNSIHGVSMTNHQANLMQAKVYQETVADCVFTRHKSSLFSFDDTSGNLIIAVHCGDSTGYGGWTMARARSRTHCKIM